MSNAAIDTSNSPKVVYFTSPRGGSSFSNNSTDEEGDILTQASFLLGKKIRKLAANATRDNLYALTNAGVVDIRTQEPLCALEASNLTASPQANIVLDIKGQIFSWGEGQFGELGLGSSRAVINTPTKVAIEGAVVAIASGSSHSIAFDSVGNLYAWGQNFDRQLGLYAKTADQMASYSNWKPHCLAADMTYVPRLCPLSLSPSQRIAAVACGPNFSVAVTRKGAVLSWGAGESGQLGTGRCTSREVPQEVPLPLVSGKGGKKVPPVAKSVACGFGHVIVSTEDGSIYAWGLNKRGQLGLGDTNTRQSPEIVAVNLPSDLTSTDSAQPFIATIYAEGHSTAAIDSAGRLYTWGQTDSGRLMHPNSLNDTANSSYSNTNQWPPDSKHVTRPLVVRRLLDNVACDFAFAKTTSAVLVLSKLTGLSPIAGPQKSFQKLTVHGCGFWDSKDVIVRFSACGDNPEAALVAPRSCLGSVQGPDAILCRPPKLTETGEFQVSVSLNGRDFMPDLLKVTVYRDFAVTDVAPRLVDTRQCVGGKTVVDLTVKDLLDEWRGDGLLVKVLATVFDPSGRSVQRELLVPGWVVVPDGDPTVDHHNDEDNASVGSLSADLDNESGINPNHAADTGLHENPLRTVRCEIDLTQLSADDSISDNDSGGSLVSARFQLSLNGGSDFCSASPESCSLLCHAFQPTQCVPVFYPVVDPSRGVELHIEGRSFLPQAVLPSGAQVIARISAFSPATSRSSSANNLLSNLKQGTVCEDVAVRCVSSGELWATAPPLSRLHEMLVEQEADKGKKAAPKKKPNAGVQASLLLSVRFYLRSAAASTAAATTTGTAAIGTMIGTAAQTELPLCDSAVLALLFQPRPLAVESDAYVRRNGLSAALSRPVIEVSGPIDFRAAAARVVLRLAAADTGEPLPAAAACIPIAAADIVRSDGAKDAIDAAEAADATAAAEVAGPAAAPAESAESQAIDDNASVHSLQSHKSHKSLRSSASSGSIGAVMRAPNDPNSYRLFVNHKVRFALPDIDTWLSEAAEAQSRALAHSAEVSNDNDDGNVDANEMVAHMDITNLAEPEAANNVIVDNETSNADVAFAPTDDDNNNDGGSLTGSVTGTGIGTTAPTAAMLGIDPQAVSRRVVFIDLLLDGRTSLPTVTMLGRIQLFGGVTLTGAPLTAVPKGGALPSSVISVAIEIDGLDDGFVPPSDKCFARIRGLAKTAPGNDEAPLVAVVVPAEVASGKNSLSFTLPDAAGLAAIAASPGETRGKDKLFFVDVSIDGQSSFDCSPEPLLQIKI